MNNSHLIDLQWTSSLQEKMRKSPALLSNSAGKDSCCIYRAPLTLFKVDENAYKPRVISIGPYHRGEEQLEMIEEHKWRYLHAHIARTGEDRGLCLGKYRAAIASVEEQIRECYSEAIGCNSNILIEMMVLDGCFLIELFGIVYGVVELQDDDPLFKVSWIIPYIMRDLLQLENQIPFLVLQLLFDMSIASKRNGVSLKAFALHFFSYSLNLPKDALDRAERHEIKHLLHLLHLGFRIPCPIQPTENFHRRLTPSASKLHFAGVKFRPKDSRCFLDITFQKGVMEIPCWTFDAMVTSLVLNCVAFEMCYENCPNDFIDYVSFMNALVRTPSDAAYLSRKNIIENLHGSEEEVVRFFADVKREALVDIKKSYLFKVLDDVNDYRRNKCNTCCAEFRHKYFSSTWSGVSAFAAAILLLLTAAQTAYTIYGYHHPPPE